MRLAAIGLGGLGLIELECCVEVGNVSVAAGVDVSPDARESFAEAYDAPAYEDYETGSTVDVPALVAEAEADVADAAEVE